MRLAIAWAAGAAADAASSEVDIMVIAIIGSAELSPGFTGAPGAGALVAAPAAGLGAAAVEANGTPEQKEKFLARFRGAEPTFGAMAMTEPQAGSDTSAIRATAVLD
jgi:alkylation response protein AidB-like acyl-CoA dehydrogenase